MTLEKDFDPDLARRLEARLSPYAPVGRIPPRLRRRSSRRVLIVGAGLAAILVTGAVGLGYEVNAAAESAGLGCLHPIAKIQFYVSGIAGSAHDGDHGGDRQVHDERASHEACHP
jgi:hypothetical protein